MGFFSDLASQTRSNPVGFLADLGGIAGAISGLSGGLRRVDISENIASLNLQQQKAILPKQIEALRLQEESVKENLQAAEEEAGDLINRAVKDAKDIAASIQRSDLSFTGGVSVQSSLDVSDLLDSDRLSPVASNLVKAGGEIGRISDELESLVAQRRAAYASGNVRVADTDTGDIQDATQRLLHDINLRRDQLTQDLATNERDLSFAQDRFADEIDALRNNAQNDLDRLEVQREQLELRSATGIAENQQLLDDIDAQRTGVISSSLLTAAGIAFNPNNPIGGALAGPIQSAMDWAGIGGGGPGPGPGPGGGLGGSGLGAGGGGSVSGAGSGGSAPFSSGGSSVVEASTGGMAHAWNPSLTLIGGASGVLASGGMAAAAAAAPSVAGGVALNAFANPLAASMAGSAGAGAGAAGASLAALGPFAAAAGALAIGGPMVASFMMGDSESEAIRQARGHRLARSVISDIQAGVTDVAGLQRTRPGEDLNSIRSSLITAGNVGGGTPGFVGVPTDPVTLASINTLISELNPLIAEEDRRRRDEFGHGR